MIDLIYQEDCFGISDLKMEWRKEYLTVIAHVIERGNNEEWAEIVEALRNEIIFLPYYAIEEVCVYFSLPKKTGKRVRRNIGFDTNSAEG